MSILEFRGRRPVVDPGSWLAPTAVVIGDVSIGEGSSIWFGAVVRADCAPIAVGARTNIQENTALHTDVGFPLRLGHNVSVGHSVVLHGCVIDDDVLVGMGALVMNGARIGTGSLVAAGALVTEGTHIPPGSLVVGVPARVVRPVTERETAKITDNARLYAELARDWLIADAES